jgi:8-amino-7-oxononanoate synthase
MSESTLPTAIGSGMDSILLEELGILANNGLLRNLRKIDNHQGSVSIVDGRPLVSFGSNDYLGLAGHPELKEAARIALDWGVGATGSRLTTGNLNLHELLEAEIAQFKHTEAAVLFSSGYAANVAVIPALVDKRDLVLSDSLNHASLIDGIRLSRGVVRIFRHSDCSHLRELLEDRSSFRRLLIITDGVFSMDGDIAPLPELTKIADEFNGWLMVDDAHGTGVYGHSGSGIIEHFGLFGRVHIQMGTLSKAVGASGAFIAGSKTLIEFLRNKARSFMFSTALPPADVASACKALELIQSEPERRIQLKSNSAQMRSGLADLGLPILPGDSPIIPLITGSAEEAIRISQELENEGFWIPAIRPPTVPRGSSRLRIAISSSHTSQNISDALKAIEKSTKGLNLGALKET